MTLRDLVLKMSGEERLLVRHQCESQFLECTPDEIINDFDDLADEPVEALWRSTLYNAIVIELE